MSVLWGDPIDEYTDTTDALDGFWTELTRVTINTTNPRTGRACFELSGGTGDPQMRRNLGVTKTGGEMVGLSFGMFLPTLPTFSVEFGITFRDNANQVQCGVSVSTTGQYEAWRGNPGSSGFRVLLATSAQVVTAASYNFVEVQARVSDTVGSIIVQHNGEEVLRIENVDTRAVAGNDEVGQISIEHYAGSNGEYPILIDDIFCYDGSGTDVNDFTGPQSVYWLRPTANVMPQDWIPTSGDAFSIMSQLSGLDSNYIEALNVGDISVFELEDLPVDVTSVKAVIPFGRMFKADSGDNNVQMSVISNAVVGAGDDRPITTLPTYWFDVFEQDPNTLAAWTPAAVNAMQLQYERTV